MLYKMENIKLLNRIVEIEATRYKSSGDYSVTSLIDPPRLTALKKRHGNEIKPQLSSVIPSIIGTAIHEYFIKLLLKWTNKHKYEGYSFEEEVSIKFMDRLISGRYDIRDITDLNDLKSCKVWKKIFDPEMEDWHKQQNLYAYLIYVDKGIKIKRLLITAIYKDWTEGSALRDKSYPQNQIEEYELDLWPLPKTEQFLKERVELHKSCEELPDDKLPACTREERWERFQGGHQIEYAIMKSKEAKRAAKVIRTTLDDAFNIATMMKGITKDSYIEVRYAQRKRCEKYCDVKDFCNHYLEYKSKKDNNNLNDYIPLGV